MTLSGIDVAEKVPSTANVIEEVEVLDGFVSVVALGPLHVPTISDEVAVVSG
jgi:hypothetical protein